MNVWHNKVSLLVACLLFIAAVQFSQAAESAKVKYMQTPSGIQFGMLGEKGSSPAPTLFVFASNVHYALTAMDYNKVGAVLGQHGYVCVALDLPYHGTASVPGRASELAGWAEAASKGEAVAPAFVSKVSQVLDYLIKEGYTDPERVAVAGSSRGGFMAIHVAAADPRFKCAVAFAPVTDLTALTEFAGVKDNQIAKSQSLVNVAEKLAGRPVWVGIGNNDERVSTERAIEFTRKLVAASVARKKPTYMEFVDVELHVMPWPGHGCPISSHDGAATWLLARLGEGVTKK